MQDALGELAGAAKEGLRNGEIPGHVARILGLMGGAGEAVGGGLEVRLVG